MFCILTRIYIQQVDFEKPARCGQHIRSVRVAFYFTGLRCDGQPSAAHALLLIVGVSWENVIGVEDGYHDQSGESGSKTAVEENEASVHACGGRAYDCVNKACKQALFPSVLSCDGTEPRGERDAVDVFLCGEQPGERFPEKSVHDTNEGKECDISQNDGSHVSWVLSVGGERQRRKEGANGGTRKACAHGKLDGGENHAKEIGRDKDDVQIGKEAESVNAEVDKADGHSKLDGKIGAASGAFPKTVIVMKVSSVHKKAEDDRRQEEDKEKDIHEHDIRIVEGIVHGIISDHDVRRRKAERAIEKRMRTDTENTDGKSRLVHIVALLYIGDTGEQSGDDKSRKRAEQDREKHAGQAELDRSEVELSDGIAEQKVADEGRERGRKHGNVQIFADGVLCDQAVDQNADEGRPHIQKIEPVKAVRDDEQVCGEGFCVGSRAAEQDHQIAGKSAECRVKKRACQASQIEIVRDQLGRGGQNADKIWQEVVKFACIV